MGLGFQSARFLLLMWFFCLSAVDYTLLRVLMVAVGLLCLHGNAVAVLSHAQCKAFAELGAALVSKGSPPTAQTLAQQIERYRDGEWLEKEREKALKDNLQKRGFDCGTLGGYACLEKLSSQNLKRMLGFPIDEALQDSELADLYNRLGKNIKLSFVHNSHHLESRRPISILSAKRLQSIGLENGRNTGPFNDKILGGADNVFFFVNFYVCRQRINPRDEDTIYGSYTAVPDRDYAARWGGSPPGLCLITSSMTSALLRSGIASSGTNNRPTTRSLRAATKKLHQLDFSVPTFEILIKAMALKRFIKIREENTRAFATIVRHSQSPPKTGVDRFKEVVADIFGRDGFLSEGNEDLQMDFEFKIPVAVPKTIIPFITRILGDVHPSKNVQNDISTEAGKE